MVISTSNLVGIIDVRVDACGILSRSWISQIRNFNGRSAVRGECASSCQISSKSVKRLQRYDNLTVFKMAAVRHVGFVKFNFLKVKAVKNPILHQRTIFRRDRSNRCGDIAI